MQFLASTKLPTATTILLLPHSLLFPLAIHGATTAAHRPPAGPTKKGKEVGAVRVSCASKKLELLPPIGHLNLELGSGYESDL